MGKNRKYVPQITFRDLVSNHIAVEGEECELKWMAVAHDKTYAVIINSLGNELHIPIDVFDNYFSKED